MQRGEFSPRAGGARRVLGGLALVAACSGTQATKDADSDRKRDGSPNNVYVASDASFTDAAANPKAGSAGIGATDSSAGNADASGGTAPDGDEDAANGDSEPGPDAADDGTPCLDITADEPWGFSHQPVRPFWRDTFGLHWAARLQAPTDRLLFETFEPQSGARMQRSRYPAVDEEQTGDLHGVAHSPDGTVALTYPLYEAAQDEEEGMLLTTADNPTAYDLVPTGLLQSDSPRTRGLAWDGEAFVWHGLINEGNDIFLAVARYDATGAPLLPLTNIGLPTTSLWNGYDMVTDPESGTTWMVSPGNDGAKVTGTRRDGTPLIPKGDSPVTVGNTGTPYPTDNAHVAAGPGGEAMITFEAYNDGFVAQRVDQDLSPVGAPTLIPIERIEARTFSFTRNAAAFHDGAWWIALHNGLGVNIHRLTPDGIVDQTFEILYYPVRAEIQDTGTFQTVDTLLRMGQMVLVSYEDELWLGLDDQSANALGELPRYRVLRVHPECTYPSRYVQLKGE